MLRRAALLSSGLSSAGVKNGIIQDNWDTIAEICKSGKASDFYNIGDGKVVNLGTDIGDVTFRLAGFKVDIKADRTGAAETTWLIDCALSQSKIYDSAYYSSYLQSGYNLSSSLGTILAIHHKLESLFPSNLYNVMTSIKKTYVWTNHYKVSTNSYFQQNYTSYIDTKVWWAIGAELFFTDQGSCLYEGFVTSLGGSIKTDTNANGLASRSWYTDTRGNGFSPSTTLDGKETCNDGTHYLLGFCL